MKENSNLADFTSLEGIDLSDEIKQAQPKPIVIKPENDEKPKKSHRKLYIILISLATIAAIAAFMLWLFMFKGIYVFQGLPLSSFSNSYYSLKIPEGFTKSENNLGGSGTDITFSNSGENINGVQSKVYIVSGDMAASQKNKYFKDLDEQYKDSAIEKSRTSAGLNGAAGIIYSKQDRDGLSARVISYATTRGTVRVGRYDKMSIYKNGKIYEIVITSPRSNPGLAVDAKKIFDSFEIK